MTPKLSGIALDHGLERWRWVWPAVSGSLLPGASDLVGCAEYWSGLIPSTEELGDGDSGAQHWPQRAEVPPGLPLTMSQNNRRKASPNPSAFPETVHPTS